LKSTIAAWTRGPLRKLIPHESAIFTCGYSHSLGITLERKLCVDLSDSYFDAISLANGQLRSPVLEKWLRLPDSMVIDICASEWDHSLNWGANFVQFGLRNGIADGFRDPVSGLFVFGCLLNVPDRLWENERLLHNVGIEQIFLAWQRAVAGVTSATNAPNDLALKALSKTELEVVKWIKAGKTNEEIALILGKSSLTVKTQVQAFLKKTSLRNRTVLATSNF
jgi:DNA-binding CsgD family transcriptional regulator